MTADLDAASKRIRELGLVGEAIKIAQAEEGSAQRSYEGIRADRSRTEAYTRATLASAYLGVLNRVADKLEALASSAGAKVRGDRIKVFGVADLRGDQASLTISRRDAGDRVAAVSAQRDLLELLARAESSGDEPLARAIAERAFEIGAMDVLNKFLETRPELDPAANRLWNARNSARSDGLLLAMHLQPLAPVELAGTSTYELEQIASEIS